MLDTGVWGIRYKELCSMDAEFPFGNDRQVLEINSGDGCTTL